MAMSEMTTRGNAPLLTDADEQSPGALPERERLSLEWKRITYTIPATQNQPAESSRRIIMEDVSGRAPSGQFAAIMGPSGSGKTSLLNALAGRVPLSKGAALSGSILLNGVPVAQGASGSGSSFIGGGGLDMSILSAYVQQDDALFALPTVFETLLFTAQLRLPRTVPMEQKVERVESIIRELGLVSVRDTFIGNAITRGVSGGERKRVNVASCMLHNPTLVFVDEPTSGLDSFQALNVIVALKAMCNRGRTVVISIHQPRSSIYALLDLVVLLSQGRVVYSGPSGESCESYFSLRGHPVPASFNPADHILDVVSIDLRTPELAAASQARVDALVASWREAEATGAAESGTGLGSGASSNPGSGEGTGIHALEHVPAPALTACRLLLWRSWKEQTGDPTIVVSKFSAGLFAALVFGLVYFRMGHDQTSVQNRIGILFFVTMNQAFSGVLSCATLIPPQLRVVNRERAAKLYGALPFYLSAFAVNLPLEILPQFVNGAIIYFMTNLRQGDRHFLNFVFLLSLENLTAIALSMLLSAWLIKSAELVLTVAPMVVVIQFFFTGYLINDASVPLVLEFMKDLSFIRYAFTGLAVNEFRGANFTCPDDGEPCLSGDDMLERLNFHGDTFEGQCFYMGMLLVGLNLSAIAMLVYRRPRFLEMRGPGDSK